MNQRFWIVCALLAIGAGGAGCVAPCHKGYEKALATEDGLPPPCRNHVHVFMMHGLTPTTNCGLNALRLKLGENGFAKVGIGELCHASWVRSEIDCILQHDPDARFVLLGYDFGAPAALSLSRDLTAKGVPVEAVVLLDPKGCPPEPCGIFTLLIANGHSAEHVPHSARVVVPGATHFGLPAHPTTVAVVTQLLQEIAERYYVPEVEEVPEWTYPHAPTALRPPSTRPTGEWDLLADRSAPARGAPTRTGRAPVTPAAPVTTGGPAAPVASNR